jgi:hypothetical protein
MNAIVNDELPMVAVKKKNIQSVIDYCIENEVEFTVKPKTPGLDDWKIELNLTQVKKAIHFGMFLKEIKSEIVGLPYTSLIAKENKKTESGAAIKEMKEKVTLSASNDIAPIFSFETENAFTN